MRSLMMGSHTIIQKRQRQIAERSAKERHYPCTVDGCAGARRYLSTKGIKPPAGLTGWEIVKLANDYITDAEVERIFTNVWASDKLEQSTKSAII